MAKRSRGAARPGQMRPTRRPARPADRAAAAAGVDTRRNGNAQPPGQAAAADVELDLPVEPRETARRDRGRAETASAARPPPGASSLLPQRAAPEDANVARDVRHIAVVAGGLVIVLFVLFLLIDVLHVITY